jgi:hypothetical protein
MSTPFINSRIKKLQAEIQKLKDRRDRMGLSDEQKETIVFHDSRCGWDHVEKCGWCWETEDGIHNWNGVEHKYWLRKYREWRKKL